LRRALLALLALGSVVAFAAPADDLKEAQRLYNQGKLPGALERVDAYLAAMPKDPQGRFLRGVILAEEKKSAEALLVFKDLTEDFPEMPEPYNNLAVLYAATGQYDRARATLELAIQTHPGYAIAYENLGDIYAQLAARSYDKALQLDKSNESARAKAARAKDITATQQRNVP
jgi:tetratricopeptide (TPR) repeat protein